MVNVAILGAGLMGRMHAECYRHMANAELVAIADVELAKAEVLAVRYGTRATAQADELLQDKSINAVDICLPTFLHRKYAVKAAKAGKHVLCEKPIALTLKDAEAMIKAAREANVKFMVAHVIRFWPEYLKLKEVYDRSELGELLFLSMTRLIPSPSWSTWLQDPTKSGGVMIDLHIHDVDFLVYLLGIPSRIYAQGSHRHIGSLFTFPQRTVAIAEGGFVSSEGFAFRMTFRATFEEGIVDFDSTRSSTLLIYRKGVKEPECPKFSPDRPLSDDAGSTVNTIWPYFSEIQYFIDCVEKNKALEIATGESAKRSLGLVLTERRSVETGEIVELNKR